MRNVMVLLLIAGLAGAETLRAQQERRVPTLIFELKPIVITAPQPKDPYRMDPRINSTLLRLLKHSKNLRPGAQIAIDSSIQNLGKLVTQRGHQLTTRYTELSFLLLEGLAGVRDFQLQSALENETRAGENPQLRAAAMVALAYTKDARFLGLFQQAIFDDNVTVRLGALEALLLIDDVSARAMVAEAARSDKSLTLRVIAAAEDWRRGSVFSRQLLRDYARHEDWFIRAMSIRYIGELGGGFEYRQLSSQLFSEKAPIVRAELAGALLRLKRFKDE